MKRKWHALIDGFTFPLVMMFIGMILLAIGNTFTSAYVTSYINVSNQFFQTFFAACKYIGSLMVQFFPLMLLLNILGKRYNDSIPIIGGFSCYVLLHIMTMFFAPQGLPSYCYVSIMGLQLDLSQLLGTSRTLTPLHMGLIAALVVMLIIRTVYKWSRQRLNYGLFTFIDNDTWFFIVSAILTVAIGIGISYTYIYFINLLLRIFNFIAADLSNPASLFIYGLMERLLELLGLSDIIHSNFWFSTLGGTWTSALGVVYNGDISVWTAQFAATAVEKGVGRLITPYYVINLFIVPSLIIGIYLHYTNRQHRQRVTGLFILTIITSLLSSSLVPLEFFLLISAPELLGFHVVLSSMLYGIFDVAGVYLGYNYSGVLAYATPGALTSLLGYLSYPDLAHDIRWVLGTGVVSFAIYQGLTWVYYEYLAQDFLDHFAAIRRRKTFVKGLGGINNVRLIDATPTTVSAVVYDPTHVDFDLLKEAGAYLVTENRFGYDIDIGPGAVMLRRDIRTELKCYLKIPVQKND